MLEFNATFLISMISFAIFILIMNWIFYKPILGVLEERKDFIDTNLTDALNSRQKSDDILKEKEEKLDGVLKQSKKIISDKTCEINDKSKMLLEEAKATSQNKIINAKSKFQEEILNSQQQLAHNTVDIAEAIAKKVLGEDFKIQSPDITRINEALK